MCLKYCSKQLNGRLLGMCMPPYSLLNVAAQSSQQGPSLADLQPLPGAEASTSTPAAVSRSARPDRMSAQQSQALKPLSSASC